MKNDYKPIKPMKEVPDQLRKLRRQFLRYQQAEIVYSLSHKKLFELASDAGAIYRFDSTVLINRDIFDAYWATVFGTSRFFCISGFPKSRVKHYTRRIFLSIFPLYFLFWQKIRFFLSFCHLIT